MNEVNHKEHRSLVGTCLIYLSHFEMKVNWIHIFRHELIIRLRLIFTCASAWCLAPLLILDIVRLSDLQLSSWGRAGLAAVWISSLFGRIYTDSLIR